MRRTIAKINLPYEYRIIQYDAKPQPYLLYKRWYNPATRKMQTLFCGYWSTLWEVLEAVTEIAKTGVFPVRYEERERSK